MDAEELLQAMQKVVQGELRLERAKMKRYIDALMMATLAALGSDPKAAQLKKEMLEAEEILCQ